MKKFLFTLGGVCAAAAGFLVLGAYRGATLAKAASEEPVDELAHKLEAAWADHHTVA